MSRADDLLESYDSSITSSQKALIKKLLLKVFPSWEHHLDFDSWLKTDCSELEGTQVMQVLTMMSKKRIRFDSDRDFVRGFEKESRDV